MHICELSNSFDIKKTLLFAFLNMNYHHDNHLPGAKAMESQSILNMKIFIMRMSQHEYFHYEKILPLKMSCFRMKQFSKPEKKVFTLRIIMRKLQIPLRPVFH